MPIDSRKGLLAMKALPRIIFSVAVFAAACDYVEAQEPSHLQAARSIAAQYTLWPTPFRAEDTVAVTQVFDIQRNNGWRLFNTLGTPMFDPQTHRLTDAGRLISSGS